MPLKYVLFPRSGKKFIKNDEMEDSQKVTQWWNDIAVELGTHLFNSDLGFGNEFKNLVEKGNTFYVLLKGFNCWTPCWLRAPVLRTVICCVVGDCGLSLNVMNGLRLLPAHVDTPPADHFGDIDGAGKHIMTYVAKPCIVIFAGINECGKSINI